MLKYRPIVLVVLDGWGESLETKGNPITVANLPTFEKLDRYYPKIHLQASGMSVGLPWGEAGNSEVGHQSLGSGVIIYQNLPRIDLAIESGQFFKNEVLLKAMEAVKKNGKKFHLLGLLSDGGVHAHIDHFKATLEMLAENKVEKVYLHAILDGRDTPPDSGPQYLKNIQEKMAALNCGKIATLAGRFYTMDRNNNWDRIEAGFLAMTQGKGIEITDAIEGLKAQYQSKTFDEESKPMVLDKKGLIEDGDVVFLVNFRADRARQITEAFTVKNFNKFPSNPPIPKLEAFITMTEIDEALPVSGIVFPPQKITETLGKVLADNNKTQLRIAETEKYAHVTYFFNAGKEDAFPGEDHILIPSKNTPSYADLPEMSAPEITAKLVKAIEQEKYDFILVNYANADMVGHTGNFEATRRALEIIDHEMEQVIKTTLKHNGCLLITADHGNAEELINLRTGKRDTEHSSNPVPLWFVTPDNHAERDNRTATNISSGGILSDIAPTILELMDLPISSQMTGSSLLGILR